MPAFITALILASTLPERIGFDGCQTITDPGKAMVDVMAKVMNNPRFANTRFIIEGHAARTGNRDDERSLSEQLASEVMNRLISDGVSMDRLTTRGYGADHPVAGESPEDYANCRVEIVRV